MFEPGFAPRTLPRSALCLCLGLVAGCSGESAPPPAPGAPATQPAQPIPDPDAPRAEFESTVWDFGEMEQGRTRDHVFVFWNRGRRDLQITEVRPMCGCTVPTFDSAPVAPGEKGEIQVQFRSEMREGSQMRHVIVSTNSAATPTVLLEVVGTVTPGTGPRLQSMLKLFDFGLVRAGESPALKTVLRSAGKAEYEIELVRSTVPGLECTLRGENTVPPDATVELEVRLPASAKLQSGFFEGEVVVQTSSPGAGACIIPVRGYYVHGVEPTPRERIGFVDLGIVRRPGEKLLSLTLRNNGRSPVKVMRTECLVSGLVVAAASGRRVPPGQSTTVRIKADRNLQPGVFRGELRVYAEDARGTTRLWQERVLVGYVPQALSGH